MDEAKVNPSESTSYKEWRREKIIIIIKTQPIEMQTPKSDLG